MIPDSEKRLAKAVAELEDLVVRPPRPLIIFFLPSTSPNPVLTSTNEQANAEDDLSGSNELSAAKTALERANAQ